jgi:uncharacterized delta-60 repeat protein
MIKNFLCFLLLTGLFFIVSVSAQPELDTTFRTTGKTLLSFTASGTTQDIVVQPDNKILLTGNCQSITLGSIPFCIIRLNADGFFDTTFGAGQGNSGYVFTQISGFSAVNGSTTGLALQNDGKIVVTGSVASISSQLVILRYNSDGGLDSSFGTAGIVRTTVNGNDLANKLLIQPDGKIVVVGYSGSSSNFRQFITRYLTNGTPDNSFGNSGVVTLDIPGNLTSGLSIALQPDGKIVTGGAMSTLPGAPNPTTSFLVTRLNANGSPDTTFDGDGFKSIVSGTNFFPLHGIVALAVQSDGQILALGETNLLYRFNPDGSPDTSFDNDGSRTALNGSSDSFDLAVTPSGKITVVGSPVISGNFPNIYFRTARYLSNGSPDTSFSNDGFLDIDIDSSLDGATATAFDEQGRFLIGGRSSFGSIMNAPRINPLFSVARLVPQPAQNVGLSGRVTDSGGKPVAGAHLKLTGDSAIIGYGRTNHFGYFHFANVPSNQTYTLSTYSKGLNYYDRRVLVDGEIANFLVVGAK